MSGVRYPAYVAARARQHRRAGWAYRRIRELLHDEYGVSPSPSMLMRWCDDDKAESYRSRQRAWLAERRAAAGDFRLIGHSDEYAEQFVRVLAANGVTAPAIARVCGVVLPSADLTPYKVRLILASEVRKMRAEQEKSRSPRSRLDRTSKRGALGLADAPLGTKEATLMHPEPYTQAGA